MVELKSEKFPRSVGRFGSGFSPSPFIRFHIQLTNLLIIFLWCKKKKNQKWLKSNVLHWTHFNGLLFILHQFLRNWRWLAWHRSHHPPSAGLYKYVWLHDTDHITHQVLILLYKYSMCASTTCPICLYPWKWSFLVRPMSHEFSRIVCLFTLPIFSLLCYTTSISGRLPLTLGGWSQLTMK